MLNIYRVTGHITVLGELDRPRRSHLGYFYNREKAQSVADWFASTSITNERYAEIKEEKRSYTMMLKNTSNSERMRLPRVLLPVFRSAKKQSFAVVESWLTCPKA
jgi:hypothetical protein